MKILSFDEFKLLESLGYMGGGVGSTYNSTVDISLSSFPYERSRQHLRMAINTIVDFNKQLKVNGLFNDLSKTTDKIEIEKLIVLRIVAKPNKYDAYISFDIDGMNYWGVIENITSNNPKLYADIFDSRNSIKEWRIKTRGQILNLFLDWFKPKKGTYQILIDECKAYKTLTGEIVNLSMGDIIKVNRIIDKEILITYNNETFYIRDENYVYFNYWFKVYEY